MLEVIFSSLGYAGGVVADKIILSRNRVPVMRFIPLLFIWLAVVTSFLLPRWGAVEWSALSEINRLALFALMIVVAVSWNIFYYQGIQKEDLTEFELIMLFSPLATMLLATVFLRSERDPAVYVAGLTASSALIASRFRRHHLKISVTARRTILAMILLSFEAILIKELLATFSPVALYFVRTTVIAIIFLILYRPKLMSMSPLSFGLTIISAFFGVIQMVLKFYGFQNLGVVETTMILLLGPFLVYIFSFFYFHEKLYKRDLAALLVIVVSILYVEFWR